MRWKGMTVDYQWSRLQSTSCVASDFDHGFRRNVSFSPPKPCL